MGDLQRLIADLCKRDSLETIVAFESAACRNAGDRMFLGRFVEKVGLSRIADQWREVDREAAVSLVTAVFARDLAYSVQLMPDAEARTLAERFAKVFAPSARFLTNTNFSAGVTSWGWTPLTNFTFDAGVLGVDEDNIGVVVMQDEDCLGRTI